MELISLTDPTVEPVSLEQVYAFLRLDPAGSPPTHPDDDMLKGFIASARERAEAFTNRSFAAREMLYTFSYQDAWSAARGVPAPTGQYTINLPRPPVLQVMEVAYYDAAGVLVVADPSSYIVESGTVTVSGGFTGVGAGDAMRVRYAVGYDESTGVVPKSVQSAILIGVQLLYDELSPDKFDRMEKRFERLLWPYVIRNFA